MTPNLEQLLPKLGSITEEQVAEEADCLVGETALTGIKDPNSFAAAIISTALAAADGEPWASAAMQMLACFSPAKLQEGDRITVCTYRRTTICWWYDNNTCIVSGNLWPSEFAASDEPGTITHTNQDGTEGPEDMSMNVPQTGNLQADLDVMFAELAADLNDIDTNGNQWAPEMLPAPNWRVWKTTTEDLSVAYGDLVLVTPQGNEFTLTPKNKVLVECVTHTKVCVNGVLVDEWFAWDQDSGTEIKLETAPTDEELEAFQTSKCAVPTAALPEPILPDEIPDPVEPGIELTKEDLQTIIGGGDDDPPFTGPVVATAVKGKTLVRGGG